MIDTGNDGSWAWAGPIDPGDTPPSSSGRRRSAGTSFQIVDDPEFASREDRAGGAGYHRRGDLAASDGVVRRRPSRSALRGSPRRRNVHRDVKPANILIDLEQRPFLIDSVARQARIPPRSMEFCAGTVTYMSPEQTSAVGSPSIARRSDIYSLAVTFHEVLTGRRMTQGMARETMSSEMALRAGRGAIRSRTGVPSGLDRRLGKALAQRTRTGGAARRSASRRT